jgi:hypothetical protein
MDEIFRSSKSVFDTIKVARLLPRMYNDPESISAKLEEITVHADEVR